MRANAAPDGSSAIAERLVLFDERGDSLALSTRTLSEIRVYFDNRIVPSNYSVRSSFPGKMNLFSNHTFESEENRTTRIWVEFGKFDDFPLKPYLISV